MAKDAAVIISGGAPNGALTAGALCAIYDQGKTFDTFYTSGAGAIFGLAFVASKGMTPDQGLRAVLNAGIHEAIYSWIPLGYKTFFKSGPFTVPFYNFAQQFKMANPTTSAQQFYNDWIDLWTAAVTPTDVTGLSEALCAHYPFLTDAVDFSKLHNFAGHFFMNAYCIEDGQMEEFAKPQIGPEHVFAALSYPFIYPPTQIGGKHYYEGSAFEPLGIPVDVAGDQADLTKTHLGNLKNRVDKGHPVKKLIVIDILGHLKKALVRRPRYLLDAYGISIMAPVVSLAELQFLLLKKERPDLKNKLLVLKFDNLTPADYPTLCDWSAPNLEKLFELGYQSGVNFVTAHGNDLPNHAPNSPDPI